MSKDGLVKFQRLTSYNKLEDVNFLFAGWNSRAKRENVEATHALNEGVRICPELFRRIIQGRVDTE